MCEPMPYVSDALAWAGACLDAPPREYPRVILAGLSARSLKRVLAAYGEKQGLKTPWPHGRYWKSAFEQPRHRWPKWSITLTINALTCLTADDLMLRRGFGAKGLREVEELLGRHGLALSGEVRCHD